ncbi:hypothetical protein VHUM_02034 [Vanrija humicola]|uniref:Uncharacterized protein n=1 Tax=Vanrija humicola TaxID=5417 RepID=A0A7D8V0U8_VANHU|nr:hypothetical protein VHUM_02034 [Vanrija humicola]
MARSAEKTEDVRVALYAGLASTGRAPTIPELAATTSQTLDDTRGSLLSLHASRDIALTSAALRSLQSNSSDHDTDASAIVMAHPFATVNLGFSVMGQSALWWGGCAWDSFALAHLLPDQGPMLVATRCPNCVSPLAFEVNAAAPPAPPAVASSSRGADSPPVAHFLVPMTRVWDDVVHTCSHQSLFCNEECVNSWLAKTGNDKGYVMSLDTLWHFARGWYAGRLERGYKRREPAEAKAYFRSVGLAGPFWGL